MGVEGGPLAIFGCMLLINITLIALSSVMINRAKKVNELSTIDLSVVEQIEIDWDKIPFVDIVIDKDSCPNGYQPVFSKLWSGTIEGCVVQYTLNREIVTLAQY